MSKLSLPPSAGRDAHLGIRKPAEPGRAVQRLRGAGEVRRHAQGGRRRDGAPDSTSGSEDRGADNGGPRLTGTGGRAGGRTA